MVKKVYTISALYDPNVFTGWVLVVVETTGGQPHQPSSTHTSKQVVSLCHSCLNASPDLSSRYNKWPIVDGWMFALADRP